MVLSDGVQRNFRWEWWTGGVSGGKWYADMGQGDSIKL